MDVDVLVIGGSQAGLATGRELRLRRADCLIVDAAATVGHAWRSRWDSLVLFTPRRFSWLPGMRLSGDPDGYPGKEEIAAYLQAYAARYALPVELDTAITSLELHASGFVARTTRGPITARRVVVATGPFQTPVVPRVATGVGSGMIQLHSSAYRNPAQLPDGRVLVVGGGNSGFQIALELARSGKQVHLAEGTRNAALPQRLLGRDLFWWLERTGIMDVPADSRVGASLRRRDPIIGSTRRQLRHAGIEFHSRFVGAEGTRVRFADDRHVDIDAIVWCTGFRLDHSWIRIPGAVQVGVLQHHAGVSPVPGLYAVGMPWQRTRGSALIGWVGRDAARIADMTTSAQRRRGEPDRNALVPAYREDDT